MEVVVDASALTVAVLGTSPGSRELRQRLASEVCHAPHLVDAELGNVLRRRVLRGEIGADPALELLLGGSILIDRHYEMTRSLATAAWALRENLSFYDAICVALAQALAVPLLTCDARLSRAPELPCAVELVGAARPR